MRCGGRPVFRAGGRADMRAADGSAVAEVGVTLVAEGDASAADVFVLVGGA